MSDVIMIQPRNVQLAAGVPALEIVLGGTPRGLVVLLTDDSVPEGEVVEVMNTLAGEGFESLSFAWAEGGAALAESRAAARSWTAQQTGVVGIGAGATAALDMARARDWGAVVSISATPAVDDVEAAPALASPWLGLFGAETASFADGELSRLRRALDAGSDVYSEVVVYPGVGPDFHRRSENGVSFAASYDGWQRTTEWLLARVESRLTPLALAWRDRHSAAS